MKKKKINKKENKEIKPKEEVINKNIMSDHIEEYFVKIEGNKEAFHSRELLKADKDVDLKTDLSLQEINLINTLMYNDLILIKRGMKPLYNNFLNNLMRLKFSLDRKSRSEFVNINRVDKTEDAINLMGNLKNISDVKK